MFIVPTYVDKSPIHGLGVFAGCEIAAQSVVWRYHATLDQTIPEESIVQADAACLAFLEMYAYRSMDLGGCMVLPGDHARFLNHSTTPNTVETRFASTSQQLIKKGEEITCDYRAFCSDCATPDFTFDAPASQVMSLPHERLYTRLQCGEHGIGLYAIRPIEANVELFAGADIPVVSVAKSLVDAIPDREIARMYYDFCPLEYECFIAPADFNLMPMGWYPNHSSSPNVVVNSQLRFKTLRRIAQGEELTTDYATYSNHSSGFLAGWFGK